MITVERVNTITRAHSYTQGASSQRILKVSFREELQQSLRSSLLTPRGVPWHKDLGDAVLSFAQKLESVFQILLLLKLNRAATENRLNGSSTSTRQTVRAINPAKLEFIVVGVRFDQSKTLY